MNVNKKKNDHFFYTKKFEDQHRGKSHEQSKYYMQGDTLYATTDVYAVESNKKETNDIK